MLEVKTLRIAVFKPRTGFGKSMENEGKFRNTYYGHVFKKLVGYERKIQNIVPHILYLPA